MKDKNINIKFEHLAIEYQSTLSDLQKKKTILY